MGGRAAILIFLIAAAAATGPVAVGGPSTWFRPGDYPQAALARGGEGAVNVKLGVDAKGATVTCAVTGVSGDAALDAATCDILMKRASFRPARDVKNRPVPSQVTVTINWKLPYADLASSGLIMTFEKQAGQAEFSCTPRSWGQVEPFLDCETMRLDDMAQVLGGGLDRFRQIQLRFLIMTDKDGHLARGETFDRRFVVHRAVFAVSSQGGSPSCTVLEANPVNGQAVNLCDHPEMLPLLSQPMPKGPAFNIYVTMDAVGMLR